MSERPCTCHPDDNPPKPCQKKYALAECRAAASSASRNDNAPKPTPYKVDTGPIPLDTLSVFGEQECWYRIPSWRVHFDHDALRDVDIRMHRAIGSHGVWTLTEASTGLKMFADLPHEFYMGDEGAMLSEFAAGRMLQLTPEKIAEAIAKGKATLSKHTPNPFVQSETRLSDAAPPNTSRGREATENVEALKAALIEMATQKERADRWQKIADQRAIEVADLKHDIKRAQANHSADITPSAERASELADQLESLGAQATPGPWAWDQRGEKVNEWGLGIAMKAEDQPFIGHFRDEDAVYVEYVCSHEAATCNYRDPDLICALRNNLPEILAALRSARSAIAALGLLKETRPYLDLIEPSISDKRPLVMVVTKCDAEALAKRIDDFLGRPHG